jgi:hypothetical protein
MVVQIGSTPKLDSECLLGNVVGELRHYSRFWTGEFHRFYNPETGFDIDGVWIDMNEPSSVRRRVVRA